MVEITHSFESEQPDGTDETVIRPSDWNSPHIIDGNLSTSNPVASTPKGTLVTVGTDPTLLPESPYSIREYLRINNVVADSEAVDISLCDVNGTIFDVIPFMESRTFQLTGPGVEIYAIVSSDTTVVLVEEGASTSPSS